MQHPLTGRFLQAMQIATRVFRPRGCRVLSRPYLLESGALQRFGSACRSCSAQRYRCPLAVEQSRKPPNHGPPDDCRKQHAPVGIP